MACPPVPPFGFTSVVQPSNTVSTSPPAGFDVQTGALMGTLCALTYTQFAAGTTIIPGSTLTGLGGSLSQPQNALFTVSESIAAGATIGSTGEYATVVGGFALTGTMPDNTKANIIALRGTRTYGEWIDDVTAVPASFVVGTNNGQGYDRLDPPYGMVHGGFQSLYTTGTDGAQPQVLSGFVDLQYSRPDGSLAAQVESLVTDSGWDATLPLYITGHSLGAALAELCAMDIAVNFPKAFPSGEIYVYSLAGPLVAGGMQVEGVGPDASTFANAYVGLIPNTWRVVNAADIVPISPPSCISLGALQITFAQTAPAGNVVSFIAQTGDIGDNHGCANVYQPYLQQLANGFS
jgi:predicted lipase